MPGLQASAVLLRGAGRELLICFICVDLSLPAETRTGRLNVFCTEFVCRGGQDEIEHGVVGPYYPFAGHHHGGGTAYRWRFERSPGGHTWDHRDRILCHECCRFLPAVRRVRRFDKKEDILDTCCCERLPHRGAWKAAE